MAKIGCVGIILLALLAGGVYSCFRSMQMIGWYASRCGAYPTVDEAIMGDIRHNKMDPAWFQVDKAQNRKDNPHIWYVIRRVKPEYQDDYNRGQHLQVACGGSFYVQTKSGWVGMPENEITGFGLLDFWMGLLNLYGGDG